MKAHLGFAHLAFQFSTRDERGDGIDDNDIDGAASDEDFTYF